MSAIAIKVMTPVVTMAALGLAFGCALALALKIFAIKVDPTILNILSLLPGVNCGACGSAGCAAFAEILAKGEAMPSACTVSDSEARKKIARLLGIEDAGKVKTSAVVLCNGGQRALNKFEYQGIRTCKAATLIFAGHKACTFGCLGFGDCVEACPFGAISMGPDGLPVVDEGKCTSCGKCVKACPKGLFVLLDTLCRYYVKCSSKDPGGITAKACKAGCIGCMKCEKACPAGAIKVESNLARIDPAKCQNLGKCFEACPTKVITRRGLPNA
ncbi:MAG: RnfABCDGE type electron transport complex subunit B [Candidatus Omnitrophica bacterium]|nr:RnfABCDGE type electron transport complex subunit B [Candidatus Omnitrophota bacterium]MCM8791222.1 RnfABCDGE type electron transport complex subunit B [Candidatus Omnitrophota bacterium]